MHSRPDNEMNELIRALPGRAAPFSNLGNVYFQLGRVDEAVQAYEKALELDPRYATGHHNLANAFEKLGRVDEALRHYGAALEINPRMRRAQIAIARIDTEAGRIDDALRRIEPLVSSGAVRLEIIESDPRLAPLVRDPRFEQFEKYRTPKQP